ncbi:hypothetical protein [Roseitranquillus sediminis]|uniref:hypothetical protein n=1 Tax=Roseitranquillus sediminis TaxID=2809051 RepID=UPI001D0BFD80|nr:hypothetical protein [Roseitranquillus sediminis]MBM9595086.1 hypothetical protein [Roseitranquillus sediminis]
MNVAFPALPQRLSCRVSLFPGHLGRGLRSHRGAALQRPRRRRLGDDLRCVDEPGVGQMPGAPRCQVADERDVPARDPARGEAPALDGCILAGQPGLDPHLAPAHDGDRPDGNRADDADAPANLDATVTLGVVLPDHARLLQLDKAA